VHVQLPAEIRVLDSHTEGEPTRVVLDGWPQPAGRTMEERRGFMHLHHDLLRRAVVCEPRGHAAIVGALLTPPVSPGALAGIVFFNNVGYLGMCGHGLIGVVRTLEHLGQIAPGQVSFDTPAGPVTAELSKDGPVTIRNVHSYCHARDVQLDVPGVGIVRGDVSYGGNWFFLTELPNLALTLAQLESLLAATQAIRAALELAGVTGRDGARIDHIELTAPSPHVEVNCRTFVLCPGGEYDRSPCGTGTSAKMATLHARGALAIGERWCQESITGGRFTGWLAEDGDCVVPFVRGRAFITGASTLRFDPADPLRAGFDETS
jgi:proline racemase